MSFSDGESYYNSKNVSLNLLRRKDPTKDGYQSLVYDQSGDEAERGRMDEFGELKKFISREKLVKTGRQRKKLAARTKGGEFQARRKKRRVYFCCVSSDMDIQKLFDYLVGSSGMMSGWKYQLYPGGEVLHLYKSGTLNEPTTDRHSYSKSNSEERNRLESHADLDNQHSSEYFENEAYKISNPKSQEVFVFDFGAAVFWGFSRGEETNLLKTFRMFVTKGGVDKDEFQSGEDDMAFITSPEEDKIALANDFLTLPDNSPVKQRLSISFAIAQSSVLAIFESRVEYKVEEYKYIPETLAAYGKVQLSERQLGIMIGEVFVIRHDVNLHTEILDTPSFFWKEETHEENYQMVMEYLEMSGRTAILNKRLDLLRELLDVLQHQMENEHGVKLEWIVIWLIVVEVILQALAIVFSK